MNQQPDKLFRDKLEGYHKPAPASAWEKIAEAQSKKKDKWLWLKVAASIAFVAAAGYMLLPEDKSSELSNNTSSKPVEEKTLEQPSTIKKPNAEIKADVTPPPAHDKTSPQVAKRNKPAKVMSPSIDKDQGVIEGEEQTELKESIPVQPDINQNIASNETVDERQIEGQQTEVAVEPENITLVYSAKDVEDYLDKKALAEATSDNKKSSTFKKLLKKAEDLTNNQDPFGELRQKKNEILALNFRSEKQRGQNK